MDWLDAIRLHLADYWWPDPTDPRKPKRVVITKLCGRNENYGYGSSDFSITGHFWDAPIGVAVTLIDHGLAAAEHDLMLGLWRFGDKELALMQVQNFREKRNRWAYQLGDRRSHVLKALKRCLPDWSFASPDGQQKIDYLLYLHGGFTIEELEAMEWAEWCDGKEVVPRVQRQYDRCPDGYLWGDVVTLDGVNIQARRLIESPARSAPSQ